MTHMMLDSVLEQIKEEIKIDANGKGKASIRATARLAGVDDKSLRVAFESAEQNPSTLAKKLIEQEFIAAEQCSWSRVGIPDLAVSIVLEYYAFDAGRYCKEQAKLAYKAFATTGIRIWMQHIKGWQQSKQEVVSEQPSVKDISEAISSVFCLGTIDPNLVQGLIANEIGKAYPQLKCQMEAVKQLLPTPVEDELVTVTNLAKLYMEDGGKKLNQNNSSQSNAKLMNKILINEGVQFKNPNLNAKKNGQPLYLPTELGKQYSKVILQEANRSNKTIQQLRWFPSVLNLID
ncbi:MAG: hypothetical protein WBA07_34590 [Rivularia sp. (in: cyanobacteria)]